MIIGWGKRKAENKFICSRTSWEGDEARQVCVFKQL
jgi:hypothetical protein